MAERNGLGIPPNKNPRNISLGNARLNTPRNGAPTNADQTVPPVQPQAHGTDPAPDLTANASNLAATAQQPLVPPNSNHSLADMFQSSEMRQALNQPFNVDKFLSDDPSPSQTPTKKAKFQKPTLPFSRKTTDHEKTGKSKSKFKFKLNLSGTNQSPRRPTTLETDVVAPPSSHRQGDKVRVESQHLGHSNQGGPAHARFQTPRGNQVTQQQRPQQPQQPQPQPQQQQPQQQPQQQQQGAGEAEAINILENLQDGDRTQSIPPNTELFGLDDLDTAGAALQTRPVTEQELNTLLEDMRANPQPAQPMVLPRRRIALSDLPQPHEKKP